MLHNDNIPDSDKNSCDSRVSRKEFLTTLVKRATVAGALIAAPKVVDKFLVPPAYAVTSTSQFTDTGSSRDTASGRDTTHVRLDAPTIQNPAVKKELRENAKDHDDFG